MYTKTGTELRPRRANVKRKGEGAGGGVMNVKAISHQSLSQDDSPDRLTRTSGVLYAAMSIR